MEAFPIWGLPNNLTAEQVDKYLARIQLDPAQVRTWPCDLEHLTELIRAHLFAVPFENTPVHFPLDWSIPSEDRPVVWRAGPGVSSIVPEIYQVIVERHRGGYCYAINSLFSALLRQLGYQVSEAGARVYPNFNQDPMKVGYVWSGVIHMVLFVDIGQDTYLADVGFGGDACPAPIALHSKPVPGLSSTSNYTLETEPLPGADAPLTKRDQGYTLKRHFLPSVTHPEGYTSPVYHIVPNRLSQADYEIANFYNSHFDGAVFTNQLLITQNAPDGTKKTLQYIPGPPLAAHGVWLAKGVSAPIDAKATYSVRDGSTGKVVLKEEVPVTEAAIKRVAREKFGFGV